MCHLTGLFKVKIKKKDNKEIICHFDKKSLLFAIQFDNVFFK